jgi:hypothetical protein
MQKQRGGTFLGFVLGLVIGLGIAMGVAFYVTKVPLPFMNKGQTRGADQNEAEAKKNKDWKRADEIRDQIQSLGITLEDTRDGQSKWFRL